MSHLPLILIVAATTWLARAGGFHLGQRSFPPAVDRFLAWIPVAAFAALITPDLINGPGSLAARLLGALTTVLVVSRAGPYWAALMAGMGAFWATSALL